MGINATLPRTTLTNIKQESAEHDTNYDYVSIFTDEMSTLLTTENATEADIDTKMDPNIKSLPFPHPRNSPKEPYVITNNRISSDTIPICKRN